MMWGWNCSGWGIFWMVLSMVLFWGGLIAIVVVLLRSGDDRRWRADPGSAIEDLRRRFAQGEITEDEYRQRLEVLRQTGT
jgi:putative membrane protein